MAPHFRCPLEFAFFRLLLAARLAAIGQLAWLPRLLVPVTRRAAPSRSSTTMPRHRGAAYLPPSAYCRARAEWWAVWQAGGGLESDRVAAF